MKRIISASRRTDIPRYFGPWLASRRRAGFAEFCNTHGGAGTVSLAPEDVLGDKPPDWLHRWVGEGNANTLGVLERLFLLPNSAGSTLNGPFRRTYDFLRTLDRDNRLVVARRMAVRSSRRVMAMLQARAAAVYRMEVGPAHYVLRGLKGVSGRGGQGRGAA